MVVVSFHEKCEHYIAYILQSGRGGRCIVTVVVVAVVAIDIQWLPYL